MNTNHISFFSIFSNYLENIFYIYIWKYNISDEATGGSVDWVKEHLQVPLVYCYELRDKGNFGFLLPADQILPNNQEVMDSLIEIIYQAKRFGYLNKASCIHLSIILFIFVIFACVL